MPDFTHYTHASLSWSESREHSQLCREPEEHAHLSHFVTQGAAEEGQDDVEHPSPGAQLIALLVPNPLTQNSQHPFLFSFLLGREERKHC